MAGRQPDRPEDAFERYRLIIDRFTKAIEPIKRFDDFGEGSDEKYLEIIRRAVVVRQLEACKATIILCDAGQAALSACFLRPAYEEMLWMLYLNKHKDLAAELIIAVSQLAICDAFKAQADYAGRDAIFKMGFDLPMLMSLVGLHEPRREHVRKLGAKLGWRKDSFAPTLTHIAQQVGRKVEYDFLYEGTSRFVHFSPQELHRRVWGGPNELIIGSNTFAGYWSQFAIYWSFRILLDTCIAVVPELTLKSDDFDKELGDLTELADGFAQVPILTSEELKWVRPE